MNEATWPKSWAGKTWKTTIGGAEATLSESELRALYDAVPEGKDAMLRALSVPSLTVRKADRALQLLRKAGLIKFDRLAGKLTWLQTVESKDEGAS